MGSMLPYIAYMDPMGMYIYIYIYMLCKQIIKQVFWESVSINKLPFWGDQNMLTNSQSSDF